MNTARASGGTVLSIKADALTKARLLYLDAFFRNVLGVRASNSAMVRYAVGVLVDEAAKLIKLSRRDPEAGKVTLASLAIGWAARDNPSPFRSGLPALDDGEQFPEFPTWEEAQALRKHTPRAIIPPTDFESETLTRERD